MSNMKIISLIDAEEERLKAEFTLAVTAAIYSALQPVKTELAQLRKDVDELKRFIDGQNDNNADLIKEEGVSP